MLYDRTDLYTTVTVNQNQELDWLSADLGTWIPVIKSTYTVLQHEAGRPDLVANYTLGDSRLWWVLCLANNIIDIQAEFVSGITIGIPSLTGYYNYYNANAKTNSNDALNPTGVFALS